MIIIKVLITYILCTGVFDVTNKVIKKELVSFFYFVIAVVWNEPTWITIPSTLLKRSVQGGIEPTRMVIETFNTI